MGMAKAGWAVALICLTPGFDSVSAQERLDFTVTAVQAAVHIDAVLEDPIWARAETVALAYEVERGDNAPAPVQTHCQLAASAYDLYFACVASDPRPEEIRAVFGKRDQADGQDRVSLILDPFDDGRRAFGFTVTALGAQLDAQYDLGGAADPTWDAVWESAGRLTDTGYVVEARIPLKSLRHPDGRGPQQWGGYFERWWPRSEDARTLSMAWDRGQPCLLCQANHFNGVPAGAAGPNVDLGMTLTVLRSDTLPDPGSGRLTRGSHDPDLGIDLRWSPTPNTSLDLTANPDFSQVESDALQLDVNNRFALFLPERRPFFMEGADLFATPLQTVFTRTIADPSFGVKLSGKSGPNAGVALVARDEVNHLLVPGVERSSTTTLDAPVSSVFGRYRRDIGGSSTLGFLYTGREGDEYHNRVISLDGSFTPAGALTVRAQGARSWSRLDAFPALDVGSDPMIDGSAARLDAVIRTRDWELVGEAQRIEEGFRSDGGFLTQVNRRGGVLRGMRTFWADDPEGWVTNWRVGGGLFYDEDLAGHPTNTIYFVSVNYRGPLQSLASAVLRRRRARFRGTVFDRNDVWSQVAMRPSGSLGLTLTAVVGNEVETLQARQARNLQLDPEIDFRLGRHSSGRASLRFQRLEVPGGTALVARFWELRASVNPSNRHTLRVVGQFRDTRRDPAYYAAPVRERDAGFFLQLLYSYQVDARTVFHLGYTDERAGWIDTARTSLTLRPAGRSIFLKGAFVWRP